MIVLRTPKGWTGPKEVDGKPVEGNFRSHQVPIVISENSKENVKLLEDWLKSYHPEELFDENGRLKPEIEAMAPTGDHRMGSNKHANGGILLHDLKVPDFRNYAVEVPKPGQVMAQDMNGLGKFIEGNCKRKIKIKKTSVV